MKKITFNMCFAGPIDGFPKSIDYYDGCTPAVDGNGPAPKENFAMGGPDENGVVKKQHYELELYYDHDQLKGILTSEHGKQKIDDITLTDFAISFSAFAGSQGVEVFHYVLMLSESTAQCVGFAGGIKPFFRGFMPLEGVVE